MIFQPCTGAVELCFWDPGPVMYCSRRTEPIDYWQVVVLPPVLDVRELYSLCRVESNTSQSAPSGHDHRCGHGAVVGVQLSSTSSHALGFEVFALLGQAVELLHEPVYV